MTVRHVRTSKGASAILTGPRMDLDDLEKVVRRGAEASPDLDPATVTPEFLAKCEQQVLDLAYKGTLDAVGWLAEFPGGDRIAFVNRPAYSETAYGIGLEMLGELIGGNAWRSLGIERGVDWAAAH